MLERLKSVFSNIGYFVLWLVLATLAGFLVFQIHATLIVVSIDIIQNPSTRLPGWSMETTYGLSRIFWLILGVLWLGWVMFTESYLREGKNRNHLIKRSLLLLLIVGVIYGISYLVLLLSA